MKNRSPGAGKLSQKLDAVGLWTLISGLKAVPLRSAFRQSVGYSEPYPTSCGGSTDPSMQDMFAGQRRKGCTVVHMRKSTRVPPLGDLKYPC